ncbi:MAG: YciI family protein [Chloroflexota bacterium]
MLYDDAQAWKDVEDHFPNMTIYYIFFLLRKGPAWRPDQTPEVQRLQQEHLANLKRLGDMGKLVINGPLLDAFATSGEIRGIGVLKTASLAEAQELISTDPMVRVGRLIFELHVWMIDKNSLP